MSWGGLGGQAAPAAQMPADLQMNVRGQNSANQGRQLRRLDDRYQNQDKGVKPEAVK